MSLILAIEPDRRQAAQLTAVIGRRLGAEVVLADTTERALDAIGSRVPDLILVPALLSPQDDATLAGALRIIATASHVQMLTIPVLASPTSAATTRAGGMFSMLRRGKSQVTSPEGCDPDVFAEQIKSYLQRQIEERAADSPEERDEEETPPVDTPAVPSSLAAAEAAAAVLVEEAQAPAPVAEVAEVETTSDVWAEVEDATTDEIDLNVELAEAAQEGDAHDDAYALDETQEVAVFEIGTLDETLALEERPDAVETLEVEGAEAVDAAPSVPWELIDLVAFSRTPEADSDVWMPLPSAARIAWPALESKVAERPAELEWMEEPAAPPPPAVVQKPAATAAQTPEWIELVESLRLDIERLRKEPPSKVVRMQPKRREATPRPAQDEWGFFDPEQCGFTALLAKLDEVTRDSDDQPIKTSA